MAYQLKKIKYREKDCHVLLQNENGPCPLLAAANCLLLKGTIALPSDCIGVGMVTIDQLVNVLAERMLCNHQSGNADHHVQEVLTIFPSLQYGMDVNPKFTAGPTGVEYTMHLNAFDLLNIELVHGWLLEPDAQEYDLIGNQTYNQLVNLVIEGNDAGIILQNSTRSTGPISADHDALSTKATQGSIVQQFLDRTSHQLTQYGLTVLHEYLRDGQMVVFFRNNHFNTLTKHDGLLYLLVTDFGYADVPSVVWEKLDVIDGDTEFVNDSFKAAPASGHATGAGPPTNQNNMQTQADYELALQLSRENAPNNAVLQPIPGTCTPIRPDVELEAARYASLEEYNRTHPNNPLPLPPWNPHPPNTTNHNNNSNNNQRNMGTAAHSYRGAFEQQINNFSGNLRQAGATIQEAASAMFPQPAPAAALTRNPNPSTRSLESTNRTPTRPIPPSPYRPDMRPPSHDIMATGIPTQPPTPEDQDRMMAMRLQRQEQQQQRGRRAVTFEPFDPQAPQPLDSVMDINSANGAPRPLRTPQKGYASRPGPPPERLVMAPSSKTSKDSNCTIS